MSGLYLNARAQGSGGYTPQTPASASSPTAANNAERAFGIGQISSNGDSGSTAAGMGSVSVGAIALALMTFIWYSLPR